MTTVTIYKNSEEIALVPIKQEFYIIETEFYELYWFEEELPPNKGGCVRIWLQAVDFDPNIGFVLPDWQLIINDVWMEKKFYSPLENIKGKKVELRHEDYTFVFEID